MIERVVRDDCLEVMKTIKDKSVDLVFADPPTGRSHCRTRGRG